MPEEVTGERLIDLTLTARELSYLRVRLLSRRNGLAARRRENSRTGHGFDQQDELALCYGIELKILDADKDREGG